MISPVPNKKEDHLQRYGLNAIDPYLLSLSVLVERFIFECGSAGGTIVAEGRSPTLNNALELAFLDLKIRGTASVSATKVQRRIHNFAIREKKDNIAGLQIADVSRNSDWPSRAGKDHLSLLL